MKILPFITSQSLVSLSGRLSGDVGSDSMYSAKSEEGTFGTKAARESHHATRERMSRNMYLILN